MSRPLKTKVTVRVPATSANLGPGFDTLGVALQLYNFVVVEKKEAARNGKMETEAARRFFEVTKIKPFPFRVTISGDVPQSRGLGSSVTVRSGVIAGLNDLTGSPLKKEEMAALVTELERHPDNAVPSFYGGFVAATESRLVHVPILPKLKFIALIPELSILTSKARRLLPKKIKLQNAIHNIQMATLMTAAFCAQDYQALKGLFNDRLHQPYRAHLIPGFDAILKSAIDAGALGSYLSGAGSTLMAVTLKNASEIKEAMLQTAKKNRLPARALILQADNEGLRCD